MKTLKILLILSFIVSSTYAQGIKLSALQDVKLAIMEDDAGNKPFTPDVRIEMMMEGNEIWDLGRLSLGVGYEFADLSGGKFQRFAVQGGFNFMYMRFFNLFDYELAPIISLGRILRMSDNIAYNSWEGALNINVPISKNFYITAKPALMQRGDLYVKYGDEAGGSNPFKWKPNFYLGLTYNFAKTIKR